MWVVSRDHARVHQCWQYRHLLFAVAYSTITDDGDWKMPKEVCTFWSLYILNSSFSAHQIDHRNTSDIDECFKYLFSIFTFATNLYPGRLVDIFSKDTLPRADWTRIAIITGQSLISLMTWSFFGSGTHTPQTGSICITEWVQTITLSSRMTILCILTNIITSIWTSCSLSG